MKLDCNAMVGGWPFHKVRAGSIDALAEKHAKSGIDGGFVSSTEAIFFNDPYEADADLAKEIQRFPQYRQVLTVNPMLPGTCASIRRAMSEFPVFGVRICPGIHQYPLHAPEVEALCDLLAEKKLPLFLTLRMEDNRSEYLLQSKDIPIWDICGFFQRHTEFPILLCNVRTSEMRYFAPSLRAQKHVAFDICGMKEDVFILDRAYEEGLTKWMVYGSNAPVFTLRSTALLLEKALIPEEAKANVWSGENWIGCQSAGF